MATKAPVPAIRVAYATLRDLLGKAVDDPAVVAMCAGAGKVTMKPDYIIAKEAGFDYALSKPAAAKRGAKKVLSTLFLYRDGNDKHRGFADMPYGVTCGMPRKDLLAKLGNPRITWKIGPGKVKVTEKDPDHDTWDVDGVELSVDYRDAIVSGATVTTAALRDLR